MLWIDTNKGDDKHANYRSRIVAREIKARKKISERISPEQLFSAMPPLEAFMIILSLFMSWSRLGYKYKCPYKIGIFDISKAHFYGVARQRVFVELVEKTRHTLEQTSAAFYLRRCMELKTQSTSGKTITPSYFAPAAIAAEPAMHRRSTTKKKMADA